MRRLLDDVSEEESLVRGADKLMHIRRLAGHLVWGARVTLRTLGADCVLPPEWVALFGRGAPFNEDDAVYPAMSDLRDELYHIHGQISEHLAGMDTADLEETLESDPVFSDTDAVKRALFLCTHDFYPPVRSWSCAGFSAASGRLVEARDGSGAGLVRNRL